MNKLIKQMTFHSIRLRVFSVLNDNFIYLLDDGNHAVLIDAGDVKQVIDVLNNERLKLLQVLITHDHKDHTMGCRILQEKFGVLSRSPSVSSRIEEWLGFSCEVVSTPGHTKVDKSFYFPELAILFSGDCLINGACGRILEGTVVEMFKSLRWISSLPENTLIFGGHDYLLDNLNFAASQGMCIDDINNRKDLYSNNHTSALFMPLKDEKLTNPFLSRDSLSSFTDLRIRKDAY